MAGKPYKPTKKELERQAFIESLPISVRYPIHRKMRLEHCLAFRRLIANPEKIAPGVGAVETAVFMLKKTQISLYKLRVWRSTGVMPTEN